MANVYDFTVKNIKGQPVKLEDYRGKVLLIVNTASQCGFTPQYDGLEAIFEKHKDKGFLVLGFPCNQFGQQEPGTNEDISSFCEMRKVSFPMFGKIDVNGSSADPLYVHLKSQAKGLLGTEAIKWNFTKFLVGRDGQVVQRYAPQTTPEAIEKDLLKLL
jgi:glutathione peroxidase